MLNGLWRRLHSVAWVPLLKDRYFLALAIFFLWMLFFDQNKLGTQYRLSRSISHLKQEQTDLREKIKELKVEKMDFEKDKEKYAREKYLLHKQDEEVYIMKKNKR